MLRMKLSNLCPPLAACCLVAAVIGMQRRTIGEVEQQNAVLQQQITGTKHASTSPLQSPSVVSGKRIDWKKLKAMKQAGREAVLSRATLQVRRALLDMSVEELVAQLDAIDALEGCDEEKTELQIGVIRSLARKAPQLVLERFAACLRDGGSRELNQELSVAFRCLLDRDAAAATAWMDKQICAGTFDSKTLDGSDDKRLPFELSLMGDFVSHDLQQARKRLETMAPALRVQILEQRWLAQMEPGKEKEMADLIRSQVDAGKVAQVLTNALFMTDSEVSHERISKLFQAIEAKPAERRDITSFFVNLQLSRTAWDRDDAAVAIETMRTWMQQEAPGDAERMTGRALGMWGQQKFDQAASLALQYQQSSGSDAALIGFLESSGSKNREAALSLTEKIHDAATRERVRKRLASTK